MPERCYMSILLGIKAELINRVLNVFHAKRSTLQRPRKIYQRASPVRIVRVNDDAGVHVCAPALDWAVVK